MHSLETDLCHGFARNCTSTDTLDEGYSSSTNICLPFAATVEKMVILAKSLHYTVTVVTGGMHVYNMNLYIYELQCTYFYRFFVFGIYMVL